MKPGIPKVVRTPIPEPKKDWRQILATYEAPALDEAMEKELCTFVEKRSQELLK
ncbi:MAG: trimethylamine methyltransferase family protein [Dehalobacterium sp.]